MNRFDKKVQNALGYYVYALIDPFNDVIFYVGKASGNNRAFYHLNTTSKESAKNQKIKEIRLKGKEPVIEILRYGLESEKSAFEVEAAIIDTIGIDNLTNVVRGHGIENGRLTIREIERLHGSIPVCINEINEKYMTFFLNRTYSTSLSEIDLYDATRQFWYNVSKNTRTKHKNGALEYNVALSIYDSVVIRVYSILVWYKAGSTFSTRTVKNSNNRWEFVGNLINDHPLTGKKIVDENGLKITSNQQGYGYIN
ncbi:hypothetical protein QA601_06555 [Chitinispirillales bacterium ANBcel5]|uniref:LEM-3-like GIY-YIG domain-containing protein n=1 Tax=Cellulosispirillum alkaliphilum TaxID=3039283 RepID=UPI002A4F56F8|nr:hypothetical protein [Chitinispirillales bacterium ANBcel5]